MVAGDGCSGRLRCAKEDTATRYSGSGPSPPDDLAVELADYAFDALELPLALVRGLVILAHPAVLDPVIPGEKAFFHLGGEILLFPGSSALTNRELLIGN